jgi:PAS domain S-box-containing protein
MREIANRLASIYIDVPVLRPGTIGAYLLAFVSIGVATALRLAIDPYVEGFSFITFFPGVIITTVISGLGAGLFSVVLSVAAAAFFVLPPRLSFYVEEPGNVLALLMYTVVMLFNVALISGMRLAVERRRDQQALQASKDRLEFALDAAHLGWWQYDPLHRLVWWNTRLKEMFGVAQDRTDVEEFIRRVHPDDRERVWAAVEAAIDPTNPKPYATEFRHCREDGEVRWIEAHAFVHFEGGGRERRAVSMVGTTQDITQRKQREEERKQQEEKEHLLANQDLLIRNRWQGVEIEDLVRAQLSPFADLMGSRIVVRGPKLRLNAASAQAVGLALHELATNAGKYGALSTDRGRVDICWTDGKTFTMSWVERQGPPVSAPERRGFGATVMEAMAERSVDGTVDLDYAPSGLAWRLTCPGANALEPANSQVEGN